MSTKREEFSQIGFMKTFVLPALLVFLIPVVSFIFFRYVRSYYDAEIRTQTLQQISQDESLTEEDQAKAKELFEQVPFSRLLRNPEFADTMDAGLVRQFAIFRWMIRLSALSILMGIAVYLLGGLCVICSFRSQRAQFISLSAGWHVLRISGAVQAIIQGILAVALSFWVTAFFVEQYMPKLILAIGIMAIVAVGALLKGFFTRPKLDFPVEGTLLSKTSAPRLWESLQRLCTEVGTAVPDQVIAGIDDNFFVTEHPVKLQDQVLNGRTLFVSLGLLKHWAGKKRTR